MPPAAVPRGVAPLRMRRASPRAFPAAVVGPVLISSYFVSSGPVNLNVLTTPAFTPANGEVIVVKLATWDTAGPMGAPTGGAQTYTSRVIAAPGGFNAWAGLYTATIAGSPGSMTISSTPSTSSRHNMVVERWGSAVLAASPAVNAVINGSGAPSANIATAAANSALSWVEADNNSIDPATRAYLLSATEDGFFDGHLNSDTVQYFAYAPVGAAGTYAIGMSLPAGQQWVMAGIEIQLSTGAAPDQNVTPTGITSSQALGAANVTPGSVTVSPTGITSNEILGNATVSNVSTINANGLTPAEQLGSATISATYTINDNGIVSNEALGSATVTPGAVTVNGNGVGTSEQLGSPTISQLTQITPSGIISNETLGNSTLSTIYTINANGIITAESTGSPAVGQSVTPSGIFTAEQLGLPSFTLNSTAAGIGSAERLGSPSVTPGAVTVNAAGIASSEASGTSTIILAQSIAAAGIATLERLGTPTVAVGAVTVNASGIVSNESFGAGQLGVSVTPSGIPSNEVVGSPAITVTAAGISAGSIASSEQLGSPSITTTITLTVGGIRTEEKLGNSTLYRQVVPGGVGSSETVGSPTLSVGTVTINAQGILSGEAFGTLQVNVIPLIPPTPNTTIRFRQGLTTIANEPGQTRVRVGGAETRIVNEPGQTRVRVGGAETRISL